MTELASLSELSIGVMVSKGLSVRVSNLRLPKGVMVSKGVRLTSYSKK